MCACKIVPCRFGIFPSWGLSQKLSRIIGPNKAREVSLTATPLTAEVAERLGFVNYVVEEGELLKKAREIGEGILKNNQDLVLRYKSVINDGLKLDLGHALALEKVICLFHWYTFQSFRMILYNALISNWCHSYDDLHGSYLASLSPCSIFLSILINCF